MRKWTAISLLGVSSLAFGDTADSPSVKSGYLYLVQGEVALDGNLISPQPSDLIHVQEGQIVETLVGRVELMLSYGAFMRIAPGSTVAMNRTSAAQTEVALLRGAAIVELGTWSGVGPTIEVGDRGRIVFLGKGAVRIDVPPRGPPRVRTIAGKAKVFAGRMESVLKMGREIGLASGGSPTRIRGESDALDRWHLDRHQLLEAAFSSRE